MTDSECTHRYWIYDDRGNHWCSVCPLWHDLPHEEDQNPADCAEEE